MATRIVLADGEDLIREGIRKILETRADLAVVGEASDGPRAVELIVEKQPEIVVLELLLSRLSGPNVIRRVCAESNAACIVLSSFQGRSCVLHALCAGAVGYVAKSSPSKELLDAIDVVRSGRSYLSPSIAGHVIETVTGSAGVEQTGLGLLTGRETEVLQLIAEGLSSKEIAAQLGVSTKTATSHRANLMDKLGIHKASSLVRFAIREGLLVP